MKKSQLLTLLLSCSLLASCNQQPTEQPSQQPTSETESVTPTPQPTTEQPTTEEPTTEEVSSEDEFAIYEKLDTILEMETLEVGVKEKYNLRVMLEEQYQNAWLDIYVDNFDILTPDAEDNINGMSEGVANVKIVV